MIRIEARSARRRRHWDDQIGCAPALSLGENGRQAAKVDWVDASTCLM